MVSLVFKETREMARRGKSNLDKYMDRTRTCLSKTDRL